MTDTIAAFCSKYLITPPLLEKMGAGYDTLFQHIKAHPPMTQSERREQRREARHNRGQAPQISLFICYTNRTGSSYLADLLHLSGHCGRPQEYFTQRNIDRIARRFAVNTLEDYLQRLSFHRQSENGVFATKTGFAELIFLHYLGLLDHCFPHRRYMLLSREDTLMQAISWYRAAHQRTWSSSHIQRAEANYDRERIEHYLHLIELDHQRWDHFFKTESLVPLRMTYESLQKDPASNLKKIQLLLQLNQSLEVDEKKTRFSVQRDATSHEWAKRFILERESL